MSVTQADIAAIRETVGYFNNEASKMNDLNTQLNTKVTELYSTWKNFGQVEFQADYEGYKAAYNKILEAVKGMAAKLSDIASELQQVEENTRRLGGG